MPPFEHLFGNRLCSLILREVFEHGLIGRIGAALSFLAAFETHLVEQDFTELLG